MPALLVTTGDTGEILRARAGAEDAGRALPGVEPHNSQLQQIGPVSPLPPPPARTSNTPHNPPCLATDTNHHHLVSVYKLETTFTILPYRFTESLSFGIPWFYGLLLCFRMLRPACCILWSIVWGLACGECQALNSLIRGEAGVLLTLTVHIRG